MTKTVISIQNVSKLYRLGEIGIDTFSEDFNRWWAKLKGKEDPYYKVGQMNIRTDKSDTDYVWALKDINAEINEGEIVGVIGKNGAGKSTLLKLISSITAPSEGKIKIKGRVGSLLEVGTGMHPDMTARENVYLNGAILGMKKHEIRSQFDDIIDFSGCQLYVDTPIKRFSSGMRVRLGFAVAAFLKPEIMIIDEVLAVGDAEFQRRALGKMREVVTENGRTLLFVSHNLAAVKYLCNRGILLKDGNLQMYSDIEEVVDEYGSENMSNELTEINYNLLDEANIDGFKLLDLRITNESRTGRIISGEDLFLELEYEASKKYMCPAFVVQIKDQTDKEIIRLSNMPISGYEIRELFNTGIVKLKIDQLPLVSGRYFIDIGFVHEKVEWHFKLENVISLYVEGKDVYGSGLELDKTRGLIWARHEWSHKELI